jgi:hypothetical protein
MARIIASVSPSGACTLDFEGFVGESCLVAAEQLRSLLAELGIQLAQEQVTIKPEFAHPAARQSDASSISQAQRIGEGETT